VTNTRYRIDTVTSNDGHVVARNM